MNGLIIQWGYTEAHNWWMSEALKQFQISFTGSSSWVGVANNVKGSDSQSYVKIMPGTSGANFYCYSPGFDNGEMVFWIAIGY